MGNAGGHVLIRRCSVDNLHSGGAHQRPSADSQSTATSTAYRKDLVQYTLSVLQLQILSLIDIDSILLLLHIEYLWDGFCFGCTYKVTCEVTGDKVTCDKPCPAFTA